MVNLPDTSPVPRYNPSSNEPSRPSRRRYLKVVSRTAYLLVALPESENNLDSDKQGIISTFASVLTSLELPGRSIRNIEEHSYNLSKCYSARRVEQESLCRYFIGENTIDNCYSETNALGHRMHRRSSLSELCFEEEEEESKQDKSYSKIKRILGMGNQEIDVYETIQAYRSGKPQQVFGQIPNLDELIELQAHSNDLRIERILEQSKLNLWRSVSQEQPIIQKKSSSTETVSKSSKIFGLNEEDLKMQKAHPKTSKVFGEPPPAKAFSSKPVKILE